MKDPLAQYMSDKPSNDVPEQALLTGKPQKLEDRCISERTCTLYDYLVGVSGTDSAAHIAQYRNDQGVVVAQHIRAHGKQFRWVNRPKGLKLQLFGQHLGSEGTLILTEGQIDAMSVYEVMRAHRAHARFVVASIHDGAASAKKTVKDQLQWVLGFKRVVIFMDQDEPGQKAAAELATIIGPTAAVVGSLPYKDPNDAWRAGDAQAILEAINNAKKHRPEAIVHAPDLLEDILHPKNAEGLAYPWAGWNAYTRGMKPGQLVMLSGGTGIGKSLFTRSIALHLAREGTKVAYIGLEEDCQTSLERMLSEQLAVSPAFHLDTTQQRENRDPEVIKEALSCFAENDYFLDKFGSEDFDSCVAAVKHYVLSENCKVVVLDHFSLLADGISLATDQRRAIDRCIKDLKTLCVELQFTMVVVCHLSRSGGYGPSHEEGGEPTLAELRGSHSLAQIPDFVVMLTRNPRADDHVEKNTTQCFLKKNRVKGELGLMSKLHYQADCTFYEVPFV